MTRQHLAKFSSVVTGLVPVTPLRRAQCLPDRDGRDKPGHDVERLS
jgi:hypothetical protein